MSCPFTHEELEDHAHDRLPEARARAIDAHVASCSGCRDELDWLRLERMAFEERKMRSDDPTAALWEGIEGRIDSGAEDVAARGDVARRSAAHSGDKQHRVVWFGSGFAAAAMAAAVFVLYVRAPGVADPQPRSAKVDAAPSERVASPGAPAEVTPVETLTRAESQYADAIATLEAEFEARRADLPDEVATEHEQAFESGRQLIEAAREAAGDDVDARMLVLDAYAAQLRTVQSAMSTLE